MKSLLLIAALSLAPFVVGCAAEDEEMEATYPANAQPVGYDSPEQVAATSNATAQAGPADQGTAANGAVPPSAGGNAEGFADLNGQGEVAIGGSQDSQVDYSDTDPSALTDFHSTLDPYGTWVDDPTYGTVWVPSSGVVGADFTPYVSAGHWVYDDEYIWVSDYSWGWAPFHYGRWTYMGGMGAQPT
jgi:hypothetical protein